MKLIQQLNKKREELGAAVKAAQEINSAEGKTEAEKAEGFSKAMEDVKTLKLECQNIESQIELEETQQALDGSREQSNETPREIETMRHPTDFGIGVDERAQEVHNEAF